MDALATIAVEIQATLAGVLVVALVTILGILDLRRAKLIHRQKMQELSESLTRGENKSSNLLGYKSTGSQKKYRLISTFSLILQFIFGIVVFAIFTCWAFYLFKAGYVGLAVLSGVAALVGILMPFFVWFTSKQKNEEMAELIKKIESRPIIQPEKDIAPAAQLADVEIKETKPEPIAVAKTVTEVQPAPETATVATTIPEPAVKAVAADTGGILGKIPEDSMLRRHYESLMASLQQPASKTEEALKPIAEPAIRAEIKPGVIAAESRECIDKERLPQDSMLRRHYLTNLYYKLESGMPSRPTDSILMRHFDSWKNHLIESEINKRLEGLDAL